MQLRQFRVLNYRNVIDSGWIKVGTLTAFVGQNEAGKSNLFDALYRINPFVADASYNIDEDWPVDRWGDRNPEAPVCQADFELTVDEIEELFDAARKEAAEAKEESSEDHEVEGGSEVTYPAALTLRATSYYKFATQYRPQGDAAKELEASEVNTWAREKAPKLVYIHDYEMSGSQVELDQLQQRLANTKWDNLSNEDQTVKIILDLAKIELDEFIKKGKSAEGRTTRSFDKRAASAHLTRQFQDLWQQKKVRFDIDVDSATLNIFAEDENVGMPVRLNRRSTGFRWYVSFAWKFTHASNGEYQDCILLLEEPGIHLHYSGQQDLLKVFQRLADSNTLLYTTHLASMVDPGFPERVRIVETHEQHASVKAGVVSSQRAPMAVIEMTLGLTGEMSGLLGNRQTLIVEGGDDAIVLNKLSAMLRESGKEGLSDRIYLWPARGASKTPMYAGFAVGQKWDAGVLLDSDPEGYQAKEKITELYLRNLAATSGQQFRVFMLKETAGVKKTDAAIEDLFPDDFYLGCVNRAYGLALSVEDLPEDGSDMISKRVEVALSARHGRQLDKGRVMDEMLNQFDGWRSLKDLPKGTAVRAEALFRKVNAAFAPKPSKK